MTNPHPLLAGMREEIKEILRDQDAPRTDGILALLNERLGPLIDAADAMYQGRVLKLPDGSFTDPRMAYNAAWNKRAGMPGGGGGMKLCLACRHCVLDGGSPDYSELTPGEPMVFKCKKNRWEMDQRDLNKAGMQSNLLMAEDCTHYEEEK